VSKFYAEYGYCGCSEDVGIYDTSQTGHRRTNIIRCKRDAICTPVDKVKDTYVETCLIPAATCVITST